MDRSEKETPRATESRRRRESTGIVSAVFIWLCILIAIALIAENFGNISSPQDLFSYDAATGTFILFGECFVMGESAAELAEGWCAALVRFWTSFTPLRLFV